MQNWTSPITIIFLEFTVSENERKSVSCNEENVKRKSASCTEENAIMARLSTFLHFVLATVSPK